jgi:hypothetical protein
MFKQEDCLGERTNFDGRAAVALQVHRGAIGDDARPDDLDFAGFAHQSVLKYRRSR